MLRLMLFACLAGVGGSFLGSLHPLAASLAVFRGQLAAFGVVVALAVWYFGRRSIGRIGVVLSLATGLTVWLPYLAPTSGWQSLFSARAAVEDAVAVYQKNMSFRLQESGTLAADILATGAELVTLQEVDEHNRSLLDRLRTQYPSQLVCPFSTRVGAVAVASRWPMTATEPVCARGLAAMEVVGPEGPVWLISVHLHWPYPHGQVQQANEILPILESLKGSVVIGGDFNMVPYAAAPRRIRAATRTKPLPAMRGSFPAFAPLFPLPIDHVWAPEVDGFEMRPLSGSDHLGILAKIRL